MERHALMEEEWKQIEPFLFRHGEDDRKVVRKRFAATKGYSAGHIRAWSKSHRIKAVIPYKSNEKGRVLPFDNRSGSGNAISWRGRSVV